MQGPFNALFETLLAGLLFGRIWYYRNVLTEQQ